MLRWKLGDNTFFNALRNYQKDPALVYGFARTADLKRNLEQASGQDLTNFFTQWYSGQGYPTYNVQWSNAGAGNVWIKMNQVTFHVSVPFFELPVALQFKNATQSATVIVNNTVNGEVFTRSIGFVADTVIIDPEAWLITKNNTGAKLPTCGTVGGLTSAAITTTTATVSWSATGGANSYDADYKPASSSTWINAATATVSRSVNLTGLTPNSLYDWRVKPNCTAPTGTYAQAQFTTASAPTCGTVTGLSSSAITSSGATVSWSPLSGANNYTVDYKPASSGTWVRAATATTSLSVNLTGLTASSLYDWRVNANCTGATGAFAQAQFTTSAAAACPGVYDVSTNGTKKGAATIPLNTDVYGLIEVSGDNDFYKFIITTAGSVTISLSSLPANYQLALKNSSGTVLQKSTNTGTSSESITRTLTAGTYYARVFPKNTSIFNSGSCYTLRVQTGTGVKSALSAEQYVSNKLFVAPNPAINTVTVALTGQASGSATISIVNQTGAAVMLKTIAVNAGETSQKLDVSNLKNGLYFIKVQTGSTMRVAKLVIVK